MTWPFSIQFSWASSNAPPPEAADPFRIHCLIMLSKNPSWRRSCIQDRFNKLAKRDKLLQDCTTARSLEKPIFWLSLCHPITFGSVTSEFDATSQTKSHQSNLLGINLFVPCLCKIRVAHYFMCNLPTQTISGDLVIFTQIKHFSTFYYNWSN